MARYGLFRPGRRLKVAERLFYPLCDRGGALNALRMGAGRRG